MSSTSTTWITDTNTKSGTVQIYSSNVSVLRVTADEGDSAILDLFADQGDDNADKWRMWVHSADDDLHFSNYTTGTSWTDILTLQDGGNVGIGTDSPASKLHVAGTVQVGVDDIGHDVKFFGATSGQYMLWDESADELVLAGDSKLSFHDAAGGENIIASSNGHLEINAGTTLDITAPTVDLNASTKVDFDSPILDMVTQGTTIELKQQVDALAFDGAADNILNIDATNNRVGIGTSSPTAAIHVESGTNADMAHFDSTHAQGGYIVFSRSDTIKGYLGSRGQLEGSSSTYNDDMTLRSENDLSFSTGGTNERMFIHAGGNVGIGTATPDSELEIVGISVQTEATITTYSAGDTNTSELSLRKSAGTTDGTPAATADDENIGIIRFSGTSDESTDAFKTAAYIQCEQDSAAAADMSGRLNFVTYDGDAAVNAMTIKKDGNVGIGTTAPTSLIHAATGTITATAHTAHFEGTGGIGAGGVLMRLDFSGDVDVAATGNLAKFISFHDSNDDEIGYIGAASSTAMTTTIVGSDVRLKTDIKDTSLEGLNIINAIKIRDFKWNDNASKGRIGKQVIGKFIADEVYEVFPNASWGEPGQMLDGEIFPMGVAEGEFIAPLIKAIQELSAKVTALENA